MPLKGNIPWNKGKKGLQVAWNKGIHPSKETREKMSISGKGRKAWNKGLHNDVTKASAQKARDAIRGNPPWNKGLKASDDERIKRSTDAAHKAMIGHIPWNKGTKGIMKSNLGSFSNRKYSGSNHYNWKGGITPINLAIRNSLEYKLWRTSVFERDNYTCIIGGKAHGSKLEADHIKPFSLYPELRFQLSNGRTLCIDCHKKTDTWGNKNRNYLGRFISSQEVHIQYTVGSHTVPNLKF